MLWVREEDLNDWELRCIAGWDTQWPNGLNKTKGGDVPDSDCVRASWRDSEVRERHRAGRVAAWGDPRKRANILAGRAKSAKFALKLGAKNGNTPEANAKRSASWEAKREARLEGLSPNARRQKLARMDRDRARQRRKVEARKQLTQGPPASSASEDGSSSVHAEAG